MPKSPYARGGGPETVPTQEQMPVTLPTEIAGNHSFLLQAMFELKGSFGEVKQAIGSLEKKVNEQSASLEFIKKTLWFAAGVVAIASVLIGAYVEHNFDRIMRLLAPASVPAQQTPATPLPTPAPQAKHS